MGIDVWVERNSTKPLLPEISDHVESDVKQAESKSIPHPEIEPIVAPDVSINIDQLDWQIGRASCRERVYDRV